MFCYVCRIYMYIFHSRFCTSDFVDCKMENVKPHKVLPSVLFLLKVVEFFLVVSLLIGISIFQRHDFETNGETMHQAYQMTIITAGR